jgi:hypothetical protein
MGLEDSRRDKFDGHTYFGTERKLGDKIVNDVVLPASESKAPSPGRHFVIFYETENNKFVIRDLGLGYGVFSRLDREISIRDNLLLQMGESYVVFNLIGSSATNALAPPKLRVKIFGG